MYNFPAKYVSMVVVSIPVDHTDRPREKEGMGMRIVNLIENLPGQAKLACEHGLSFYIETRRHKILVDAGTTGQFADNAEQLGVDLGQVDLAVLSHGHYDHGGGLVRFTEINSRAPIYRREGADGAYYHQTGESLRYIGLPEEIKKLPQFITVEGDLQIDEEVSLFSEVTGRRHWPSGNRELVQLCDEAVCQDEFAHEQYLALFCEGRRVLVSGCAHNGILNILDRYRQLYGADPDLVFSGFHMAKKQGLTEQDREEIRETALELTEMSTTFYTGHCTGQEAFGIMKEIMGDKLHYMYCGDQVCIDGTECRD